MNSDTENSRKSDETAGADSEKKHFFQPTQNGWTVCVYVFLVALFYVVCVMLGLNIQIVPKLLLKVLSVVSPLIYGFVIAFVLTPVVRFFEKKIFRKWKKRHQTLKHILCITVVYVLVVALIALSVIFLVPQISVAYRDFTSQLSENVVTIRNAVADVLDKIRGSSGSGTYLYYDISSDLRMDVTDLVIADSLSGPFASALKAKNSVTQDEVQALFDRLGDSINASLTDALPSIFSSAVNILLEAKNILLGMIISVYFLVSKNAILRTFDHIAHAWLPARTYRKCAWLVNKAKNIFRDYIIVRVLDSFIVALISFIGLLIIGNDYALLLAMIIGLSAMIPFIGPAIGIAICSVMMLFLGFRYAIGFAIVMVAVQLLDDRIFEPLLNRGHSQHRLAGVWVFSAVVIMSGFFGFWGLLLGIPLFAFIYSIVKDLAEKKLKRNGMSIDTQCYGYVPLSLKKRRTILDHEKQVIEKDR